MSAKRQCIGTTRKGQPCRAHPLKGHDVCLAHADEETRGSIRFGGVQPGSGRPRNPRPSELARELVERHVTAVLAPYFAALGLELHENGGVTSTTKPTKFVWAGVEEPAIEMLDLGAMIAAAEKLQDRVYGKPKQSTEISGPEGGPIELEAPADHTDRATRAAMLLREAGLLDAQPKPHSNGNGRHAVNGNGNGHH